MKVFTRLATGSSGLVMAILVAETCFAATIPLPSTAAPNNTTNAGFFPAGVELTISVTGTIDLILGSGAWVTNPDGSLVGSVTFFSYPYANLGQPYPTDAGGDGINHFPGGGANFDTSPFTEWGAFGFAGPMTTDTTDLAAVRFGAVAGTFSASPARSDWFLIGYGTTVTVPAGGASLYLAINDSSSSNNVGAYSVEITAVPEPASLVLLSLGITGFCTLLRRSRARVPVKG